MATKQELQSLLEQVEAATGPDREIDADLFQNFGGKDWDKAYLMAQEPCGCPHDMAVNEARKWHSPKYTASIDAALALVERVLPGSHVIFESGLWFTCEIQANARGDFTEETEGKTLPLAILAALLRALIAQADEVEG